MKNKLSLLLIINALYVNALDSLKIRVFAMQLDCKYIFYDKLYFSNPINGKPHIDFKAKLLFGKSKLKQTFSCELDRCFFEKNIEVRHVGTSGSSTSGFYSYDYKVFDVIQKVNLNFINLGYGLSHELKLYKNLNFLNQLEINYGIISWVKNYNNYSNIYSSLNQDDLIYNQKINFGGLNKKFALNLSTYLVYKMNSKIKVLCGFNFSKIFDNTVYTINIGGGEEKAVVNFRDNANTFFNQSSYYGSSNKGKYYYLTKLPGERNLITINLGLIYTIK